MYVQIVISLVYLGFTAMNSSTITPPITSYCIVAVTHICRIFTTHNDHIWYILNNF